MEIIFKEYQKYRWFYTKSGKLAIGGKSSAQNDSLLRLITPVNREFVVMHTSEPGSPFTVIIADVNRVTKSDKEECAIFTACFSKAWKQGKEKASVDIFLSSQLFKSKAMKEGTWGVKQPVERISVPLKLALIRQNNILRAVPPSVASKKEILFFLAPGKIDKTDIPTKVELEFNIVLPSEELLAALPAGGSRILKK